MQPELYQTLSKGWNATTRILFNSDIGDFQEYAEWLGEYLPPLGNKKSYISGRSISLQNDFYPENGRFISQDEIDKRACEPLSINEIKDIDSITRAVSERWEYAGNKIMGNSRFIENSDYVVDSHYISNSINMSNCSYMLSCFNARLNSKYCYGSGYFGNCEFLVRTFGAFNSARVFESYIIMNSSDTYLSHNCDGCSDILFSFFQKNKRCCIGNLELTPERYAELKKKIISEISEELKAKKRFPALYDLVPKNGPDKCDRITLEREEQDFNVIEKEFTRTCKVVLGKELKGIGNYEKWLSRNIGEVKKVISAFGNENYLPKSNEFYVFTKIPEKRAVCAKEGPVLGKLRMKPEHIETLEGLKKGLEEIGYLTAETLHGIVKNRIESGIIYDGINSYKTFDNTCSENLGVNSFIGDSKNVYGSARVLYSQFCINCYYSVNLQRCFEVDTSSKCSDSYFCHNVEGMNDSMFCFNVKAKRNAIGNLEITKDKYSGIKKALLEQLVHEIENEKELRLSIFNIGSRGGKLWYQKLMKN